MMTTLGIVSMTAGSVTGAFTFVILLIKLAKPKENPPTITREDLDNARMDAVFQTKLTTTMSGLSDNMKELYKQSVLQTENMKSNHKRLGHIDGTLEAVSKEFTDSSSIQHQTQKIVKKIAKKILNEEV